MEGENYPHQNIEMNRNESDLEPGTLIQLPSPPYLVKIISDEKTNDLSGGLLHSDTWRNIFRAMPDVDKQKIRSLNPETNLD